MIQLDVKIKHKPRLTLLSDLIGEFVADTEAAQRALESGRPRGPITGLQAVDNLLGTYLSPGLHILQGAPGCGKTAFALQTASDCAFPCLYVSAEMPLLELFRRLIARQTKTFLGKLKTGEIGGKEAQRLAVRTIENLPHVALMDCTRGFADVEAICIAAEGLQKAMNAAQVLIIIDSLTVWAKAAVRNSVDLMGVGEYEIINQGVLGCTNIANYLNSPLIALSHRNRAGNKSDGGLHAAKGSGSIEYEAETVLDLEHLDRDARTPDSNGDVKIKITAHKNRNGIPNISVPLLFNGRTQAFVETQ